jgi:hypothetical protein
MCSVCVCSEDYRCSGNFIVDTLLYVMEFFAFCTFVYGNFLPDFRSRT